MSVVNEFGKRAQKDSPDEKVRVLLVQGSPRAADNCPQQEPKTAKLVNQLADDKDFSDVELDVLDLAVRDQIVQPCKACVSTAAPLCVWHCNCYEPNSKDFPDLMHDENVYQRLERSHGFIIFTPIHWYGPSTMVKAMFDRLVCANGGLQFPDLIDGKDADKARKLEKSPQWEEIRTNHLEGRYAGFFIMGDNGANEGLADGTPKWLHDKDIFDPEKEAHFNDPVHAIMPLVWQTRYSGIWVKEDCIDGLHVGEGLPYADNIKNFNKQEEPYEKAKSLLRRLLEYIEDDLENISIGETDCHEGFSYGQF